MKTAFRAVLLLWLACCLSGCWYVLRFTDDSALALDARMHGRWTLADDSGELVIASGSGCGLVQFIAEDDLMRLCSLGGDSEYLLLAFLDLQAEASNGREYSLGVARSYSADRIGLVMLDGLVTLDELHVAYQRELRDPECASRPADDQAASGCTRLLVDASQVQTDPAVLARLYAAGCCKDEDDETILLRAPMNTPKSQTTP